MSNEFGRRKTDHDFIVYASEEIGKLKEGYQYASKGYMDILAQIHELDTKLDDLKSALYGDGPDNVGLFERIRALTVRVGLIMTGLCTAGAFVGRYLERVIFK